MTLHIYDELWNNYVTPPLISQGFFDNANSKYLGSEVGTDKWGLIPGRRGPLIGSDLNGMLVQAKGSLRPGDSGDNNAGASIVWKADAFPPDHWAEMTQPPPIFSALPSILGACTGGACVRQDPLSDSCYAAYIIYVGPSAGSPGFCNGNVWLDVARYNNGVETTIARVQIDGWAFPQDHWYLQLQVWGENPVNLRVISKAPTMYVPGNTSWNTSPSRLTSTTLYNHPVYGLINVNQELDEFYLGVSGMYSDWNTVSIPPDNSLFVFQGDPNYTKANPNRCWVVWEGIDSSDQQLLSGQPGMRFNNTITYPGIYGGAKFSAGDLEVLFTRASPRSGTYTGQTDITLTCGIPTSTIYYTTDGSTPTQSSPVYSGPISINQTTTLKYFAVDAIGNAEAVNTQVYVIQVSLDTDNMVVSTSLSSAELVGVLGANPITLSTVLSPAGLVQQGYIGTDNMTLPISISPAELVALSGAGSIRSPDGSTISVIDYLGQPITIITI